MLCVKCPPVRDVRGETQGRRSALQAPIVREQAYSIVDIIFVFAISCTYGHSQLKTGHPVRSAIHKQLNGRLVLRWVTTWESLLLYVLHLSHRDYIRSFLILATHRI